MHALNPEDLQVTTFETEYLPGSDTTLFQTGTSIPDSPLCVPSWNCQTQ